MKTLDSLIEQFENAVAEQGVVNVAPQQIVATWEAESGAVLASEAITELLRVWLEYRFVAKIPASPSEATALFPQVQFSRTELQCLEFEYQRLSSLAQSEDNTSVQQAKTTGELPHVGQIWDDFLLLEMLGEGAFARVYLARQLSMSGRLVALKLTFRVTIESQLLARLHHSAIVPIYSMHQQDQVYGLCMPYLGNTTLMDLLKEIRPHDRVTFGSVDSAHGHELLEILVHRQAKISTVANCFAEQDTRSQLGLASSNLSQSLFPADSVGQGEPPFRRAREHQVASSQSGQQKRFATAKVLSKLDYVGAITWIGSQLADALDHAHRNGVLHCDIKPANVLLATDGQARLLDFNVSLEGHQSKNDVRVGGTLAYMAPEHLAAVQGQAKSPLDARSDIYSLGVVLFEMLAGNVPRPHANGEDIAAHQLLKKANPAVSPALAAIIGKCLANRPEDRYVSADQLYDDLNAQCNSLPLVHLLEPSVLERSRKWVRRHPLFTSVTSISLFAASLLLLSILGFLWRGKQLQRLEFARRADQVQQLLPNAVALASVTRNYPELKPEAIAKSTEVLLLLRSKDGRAVDVSMIDDLTELQTLVRLSKSNGLVSPDSQQSMGTVSDSSQFASMIKQLEAALHEDPSDSTSQDSLLEAFLAGRFSEVLELGEQMPEARRSDYATWMFLGQSNLKLNDFAAARECFSVCIGLRPSIEVAWFYRGIARLESGQFAAALSDFSKALALRPNFPSARYNMALAFDGRGETEAALEALDPAIAGGWRSVSGYAFRSNLHRKLGNQEDSQSDLVKAVSCTPTTELDWIRRGTLRLATNAADAKSDFESALSLNPNSLAARQNLAHVLAEQLAKPEESLAHLDVLVEMDAQNAERWAGRGVVLARLKHLADALRDLSHASGLSMTNPLVAYQVACGYSIVASHLNDISVGQTMVPPEIPPRSQVAEAAMKWYRYAVRLRPDIAQIAKADPDIAWLRSQTGFLDTGQTDASN